VELLAGSTLPFSHPSILTQKGFSMRSAKACAALSTLALMTTAGCGSGSTSTPVAAGATTPAGTTTTAPAAPDAGGTGTKASKNYNITYIQGITGNPFFTSVTCGAQAEAKQLGVTFNYQGGKDYSPESQTPILNAVIAKKPDGIIISPMAGQAMVPPLSQAKAAGIKTTFVDSTAADASLASSFVTSDNTAGGALAADKIGELLGGKGKVIVMGATPGISTTDARQKGFEAEIKAKYPNVTLLPTQFSQSQPATATTKLSAVIAKNSDLGAVFAVSTQEVEGVSVAVKTAGKAGKIKIVGFDTSDPIIESVKAGTVTGLVVQEPLAMGKLALDQLVAALDGKPTTPLINTPFVFLTKDNVSDPAVNKFVYKTSC